MNKLLSKWENDILQEYGEFELEELLELVPDENHETFLIRLASTLSHFKAEIMMKS